MLGIFLVVPIFSAGALEEYAHATPFLAGLALGGYALTQALFQIPMGGLSDHLGRRLVLFMGLVVFALGSFWAYWTPPIEGLIAARLVQGMGAVSAVVMAAMGDLTPPQYRARVYMLNGLAIGSALVLGILLGGMLSDLWSFRAMFLLLGLLALTGALLTWLLPPLKVHHHPEETAALTAWKAIFIRVRPVLLMAFLLSALLQVYFFVLPLVIKQAGWSRTPIMVGILMPSLLVYPLIHYFEKRQKIHYVAWIGYALLWAGALMYLTGSYSLRVAGLVVMATAVFLMGYSLFQPVLPALITRLVGMQARGRAMALYNFAAYIGMATGGPIAGWVFQASQRAVFWLPLIGVVLAIPVVRSLHKAMAN